MTKIDPSLLGKVPLSYFLGTLGMPGKREQAGNTSVIRKVKPIFSRLPGLEAVRHG